MAKTAISQDEAATEPGRMSFAELITLSLQLNGRLDLLWQRVLYSHAAIVGVMVFFGSSEQLYPMSRLLVFGFYTANMIITIFAFTETLMGLKAAISDLKALQDGVARTNVQEWIFTRNYDRHFMVRILILAVTWLLLAYLLILPLLWI